MTLKTSLIITGDASVAKRELDSLAKAVDAAAARSRTAAGATSQLSVAQGEVATSARGEAAAMGAVDAAMATVVASAARLNTVMTSVAATAVEAGTALRQHAQAVSANEAALTRSVAGLGVFETKLGTVGGALAGATVKTGELGASHEKTGVSVGALVGKLGIASTLIGGVWGIAISAGTQLLSEFVAKLFDSGDAAGEQAKRLAQAAEAADSFGAAQSRLGKIIDLNTGKLKTHNAVLIEVIKNQAMADIRVAQNEQKAAAKKVSGIAAPTWGEWFADNVGGGPSYGGAGGQGDRIAANLRARANSLAPLKTILTDYVNLTKAADASPDVIEKGYGATIKAIDALGAAGKLAGRDLIDTRQAVSDLKVALDKQLTNQDTLDVLNGKKPLPDYLKPYQRKKTRTPRTPKVREDRTTPREAEEIQRINEQWDQQPALVDRAAQATRKLDSIIADLTKRKPPGFEKLIADAKTAKGTIEEGLNKPFEDFMRSQREQLQIGALINSGHQVEAEALRSILSIEKNSAPLNEEKRAAIVASTAALHEQARALEAIRAEQQANLNALQDMKGVITQSIYEGPGSLKELPGRMLDAFKRWQAELITEKVFGDLFRDLRDQVMGVSKVDAASARLVSAFADTGAAAQELSAALRGAAGPSGAAPATPFGTPSAETLLKGSGILGSIGSLLGLASKKGAIPSYQDANGDIVVAAKKTVQPKDSDPSARGLFGDALYGVFKKIGLGENAADAIGHAAGKGLTGAFEGQAAAGVASLLGIKTSSTGAGIGGALGALSGIPGGSIIGGLLGGIFGGLFRKTPAGTASLTSNDSKATVTGNDGNAKAAATSLAGAVQQGIDQIAEQLGGTLGNYNVSIGTFDGKYRVSTTGFQGQLDSKTAKGQGLHDFGTDGQAAAIAFAIADAIQDGAVQGLSPAVAQAIKSSDDLNKALKEALKVQNLELDIGGIGAQLDKAFRDFEADAKDRLRMARQYGLDVLAVEQKNNENRVKLVDQLLKQQVGGLQNLITEMTTGSLFEGTAIDKISALNDAIAKAKSDLDAGIDGAGDTLANLYEQRLSASKDAYGTTSGYAADRNATLDAANVAIAQANARIAEAQAKNSDPALATTNAALDENNDQNAQILAALNGSNTLLAQIAAALARGGSNINLANLALV